LKNLLGIRKEDIQMGKTSGAISYGKKLECKVSVINNFLEENQVKYAIEFGCIDDNQFRAKIR